MLYDSTILSNEAIKIKAPSVFAEAAHNRVSDRYSFLPTINVVDGMRKAGWMPVKASEQRVRAEDRRGFQKHELRFRRAEDVENIAKEITRENHIVDRHNPLAEFLEVVMVNSHDRSSAYQLHAGIFRLVCRNGLIVCDSTFSKISIRHTDFNPDSVINGTFKILEELPAVKAEIAMLKETTLSDVQRNAFAEAALVLKYDELEKAPVNAKRLLEPRRMADMHTDVWSTFNTIQENMVKGGLRDRSKRKPDGTAFKVTREVKGIDENIRLNKALWHLAKVLAKS